MKSTPRYRKRQEIRREEYVVFRGNRKINGRKGRLIVGTRGNIVSNIAHPDIIHDSKGATRTLRNFKENIHEIKIVYAGWYIPRPLKRNTKGLLIADIAQNRGLNSGKG